MTLHVTDYARGGNMWLTILSYLMIRTQTLILQQINPYKIQNNKGKYVHPWHQLERTNQKLEQFLWFYTNTKQDNWVHFLPLAEFIFNSRCNKSTKKSPFEVLMGYNTRAEWTTVSSPLPQVIHHLEKIQEAWDQACLVMRKSTT